MKLSTRSRYGLRAMYDLATQEQDGPIALKGIAQRQSVSDAYLEQLFASLKRAGLVRSCRGAAGGYNLTRPAKDITVGDILKALEGSTSITDCVGDEGCGNACFCPNHPVFAKIQQSIDAVLSGMTLQDMIEENNPDSASGRAKQQEEL